MSSTFNSQKNPLLRNLLSPKELACSLLLLSFLSLLYLYSGPAAIGQQTAESGQKEAVEEFSEHPEPKESESARSSDIQVFLPPVIEKNKAVFGTMYFYSENGSVTLAQQKYSVNDREYASDDFGSLSFIAPDAEEVKVKVTLNDGSFWEQKYFKSEHGLLVSDKDAVGLVDKLDALSQSSVEPVILLAPSAVEAFQTFVVIGKNFSGKQTEIDLEIDNKNSDIIAASNHSIVAISNRYLKVGPIKEMRVSCRGLDSLPVEIDVCQPALKVEEQDGKRIASVNLVGTTLPLAVTLLNLTESEQLRFGGWKLGNQNVFLSPGGMQNRFSLSADAGIKSQNLSASVISNSFFDPYTLKSSKNILSQKLLEALEKAEILRLKKRAAALEFQLATLSNKRQSLLKNGSLTSSEDSKLENQSKAASARLFRINRMLKARRAVIESYGALDFNKIIEAANSGIFENQSLSSLDSILQAKDLGFSEARLIRIVGKRAAERELAAKQSNSVSSVDYQKRQAAVMEAYKKKFGKRAYIPPPPGTVSLVPPPPAFIPDPKDLNVFPFDLPIPQQAKKATVDSARRGSRTLHRNAAKSKYASPGARAASQGAKTARPGVKATSQGAKTARAASQGAIKSKQGGPSAGKTAGKTSSSKH